MGGVTGTGNAPVVQAQQPFPQVPTDITELTAHMMNRGRPSYDWSLMGDVAELAGQVEQPIYTTPPPQYMADFWRNWQRGQSVDGAPFQFAGNAINAPGYNINP